MKSAIMTMMTVMGRSTKCLAWAKNALLVSVPAGVSVSVFVPMIWAWCVPHRQARLSARDVIPWMMTAMVVLMKHTTFGSPAPSVLAPAKCQVRWRALKMASMSSARVIQDCQAWKPVMVWIMTAIIPSTKAIRNQVAIAIVARTVFVVRVFASAAMALSHAIAPWSLRSSVVMA
jgi:hypothetical protein